MTDDQKLNFANLMAKAAVYWRRDLEADAIDVYWEKLRKFDLLQVNLAFEKLQETNKFFPLVSELLPFLRVRDAHREFPQEPARRLLGAPEGPNPLDAIGNEHLRKLHDLFLGDSPDSVDGRKHCVKLAQSRIHNGVAGPDRIADMDAFDEPKPRPAGQNMGRRAGD